MGTQSDRNLSTAELETIKTEAKRIAGIWASELGLEGTPPHREQELFQRAALITQAMVEKDNIEWAPPLIALRAVWMLRRIERRIDDLAEALLHKD